MKHPFKIFLLLWSGLVLGACADKPLRLDGGVLSGEHHWAGRIELRGDVELVEGSSLTIAPGTELVFLPAPGDLDRLREHPHFVGSELIVRGRISAEGTPEAPIIIGSRNADDPPGSWGGINLADSPEFRFSHVMFRGADSAVHVQESNGSIDRCIFRNNLVGVRFHSSRIRITRNLFEANGSGVRFHFGAPTIRRNLFRDNDKSLFMTSYPRDFRIEQNHFLAPRSYQVVLGEEVPEDVDLSGNWWGGLESERLEALFFDGRRDAHLGRVVYRPALAGPLAEIGQQWP